jgi:2-polyprenyl-3-methyl-5-hydroxy-6-metoxy-1,4-benzoquinol methylase
MKRVELHTHSKYSPDSITSLKEIIETCVKKGINVLAVTDHNRIEGALRLKQIAPFEVIVGEEILTNDGEIIGLFLKELIPSKLSMDETIKKIKKQGGLVYLPHPFDKTTRRTSIKREKLETLLPDIDIIEVYNGRSVLPWDNNKAKELATRLKKAEAIGSDAHTKFEYGRNYLEMPDFVTPKEFMSSLKNAKIKSSWVLYFVFFITKWARFINKRKKESKLIEGKTACDVCGSNKLLLVYPKRGPILKEYLITDNSYGAHYQIVQCIDCRLVFAYPIDRQSKVVDRYQDFKDPEYDKEREGRVRNQEKILKRINGFCKKKGRLLEVGCATGGFLELARRDGWEVVGVEPSKWAVEIATKKYKLPVQQGTLDQLKIKEESFDVVVCLDVIEHVSSPRELLSEMHGFLKPDGLLCLVTPDKDSFIAKFLGERWWHIRPDHIFYFSEITLEMLLVSIGFKKQLSSRYGWTFSYDYWISRFEKKLTFVYKFGLMFKKIPILKYFTKRFYTINFRDSLELYYRKK